MQVNKWTIYNLSRYWTVHCALCGANSDSLDLLCSACLREIRPSHSDCQRCALPLAETEELVCGSCQKAPPPYERVYSFAAYQAPLDRLILQFKFQQKLAIGNRLGSLMAQDIAQRKLPIPDVLLPVPLHAKRLRQRGYNQALELARPIANYFSIPLDLSSCVRSKVTEEQMGLSAKKRVSNMKGAFQINKSFADKRVAIIDDVMTTGSTVTELTHQLIKSGAKQVDIWVCARAEL